MPKTELEKLIRKLIRKGDEYDKFDLKSSYDFSQKKDKIRLVKCIASIANSDSTYFDNTGYIVLGAKRGKLVGGFDALEKDSTSANMQNWVRDYLDPKVKFSVERFKDQKFGWWGVIVIPTSSETHVFRKEYSDTNLNIRRGDVYVRDGDSITLADKSDHDRLQRRKFRNTIDKFESKIERLEEIIEEQKSVQPDLKLYFIDEKHNQHDSLEVQPVFIEKTREECVSEVLREGGIKKIEKELEELRKEIESEIDVGPSISTKQIGKLLGINMLESYKQELSEYLEKFKEYRVSYRKYESLFSRVIKLKFVLLNNGDIPAEGIKFYIYFPRELELSNEINFFKAPEFYEKRPRDPRLPSLSDILSSKLFTPGFSVPPIPEVTTPTYGGPTISKIRDSIQVMYWSGKLLQKHTHYFNPVYLLSPDNETDLNLKYSIYAENVPGASEGTLQLKIIPKK